MFHKTALVLFALVVAEFSIPVQSTLQGQAQEKLLKLKEVVQSAIQNSQSQLEDAKKNFNNYVYKVHDQTSVEIDDETKRINGLLNDIKTLAAGMDLASCLSGRESYLNSLPTASISELNSCFGDTTNRVDLQIYASTSDIKNTNNAVNELSNKLALCSTGSIICVSPVLRSIEAAIIEIPETVDKMVHQATELIDVLTPEIDGCRGTIVASYTSTAQGVLDQISNCVNNL